MSPRAAQRSRRPGKPEDDSDKTDFVVRGTVYDARDTPLGGVVVEAVDRDLRSEENLGKTKTGEDGTYEIRYTRDQFARAEKRLADLVVRARGPRGKLLAESDILFNAGEQETVDLVVDGPAHRGPSDWETLARTLEPLLDGVAPAELTAEDEAFLAGDTGLPAGDVSLFVRSNRLSAETGAVAPGMYALLRQGLPFDLQALVAQAPETIERAVVASVEANLVPRSVLDELQRIVELLRAAAVAHAVMPDGETPTLMSQLLGAAGVTKQAEQEAVMAAYAQRAGDAAKFWEDLRADPKFGKRADKLQRTVQLGVMTQGNPALVARLEPLTKRDGLAALATLETKEWQAHVAAAVKEDGATLPAAVPGETDEQRLVAYASVMERASEDAFPRRALEARFDRDPDLDGGPDMARFLSRNEGFDFRTGTLSGFLAANPRALDGLDDPDATVTRLKALERFSRMNLRPSEMHALLKSDVGSAHQMMRMGPTAFTARHAAALGGEKVAMRIYDSAQQVSSTALNVLALATPIFDQVNVAALPQWAFARQEGVPDWETLFGSIELCECRHCRSVLSPAAYLTDVLAFLRDRPSEAAGRSAKDVLFARRPDLGEIELTCENTNTPLPYVDLVNEVLENAVAPVAITLPAATATDLDAGTVSGAVRSAFESSGFILSPAAHVAQVQAGQRWHVVDTGWRFPVRRDGSALSALAMPQTSGSVEDLAANPEHANPAAYEALRQAVYPWGLPFDLWVEEARAYLGHLGVPRHELMDALRAGASGPSEAAIAAEALGLSDAERQIVTGAHAASSSPWQFYGYASSGSWLSSLRRVRTLLDRTGMTFAELEELLRLRHVNPGGALTVASSDPADPHTCDTAKLEIAALDRPALERLVRFVRLQRRSGWTPRELDRAIAAVKPAALDDDFLRVLWDLRQLSTRLKRPLARVLGLFAALDTAVYGDLDGKPERSLYQQLFQNPAVIKLTAGEADPFALNAADTELATVGTLTPAAGDSDAVAEEKRRLRAAVAAAVGLTAADLGRLLEGPAASGALDLENLSRLYRHATLAARLKLSVEDLLRLKELTGIDPFVDGGAPVTPADTRAALDFVEQLDEVRASGASLAEVDYLLRHRTSPSAPAGPSTESIAAFLDQLRAGLRAIADETAPAPDPTGERTGQKLAVLGWDEARVGEAVEMLAGTRVYEAPLNALPAGVAFPAGMPVSHDADAQVLRFVGPMAAADRSALLGLSGNAGYQTAVQAVFDAPRAFVARRMRTFVEPTFEAELAALPVSAFPPGLADRIAYDSDAQRLRFVGEMSDDERAALLALSADAAYQAAVQQLAAAPATFVPPPDNAFLAAADAAALFDAPRPAEERFAHVLARLDAYLRRTASESLVKQTLSERLKLDVATADVLLVDWPLDPAQPARRAIADLLSPAFVGSLDKPTPARFPAQFRTFTLLDKAAGVVRRLALSTAEVRWVLERGPTVGWLDLRSLPAAPGEPVAAFADWMRLVEAMRWRAELPAQPRSLLDLIDAALAFDPASAQAGAHKRALLEGWSELAGWPLEQLAALLGALEDPADGGLLGLALPAAAGDPNPYADERTWLRVRDAVAALTRLGAQASEARAWAQPALTAADARSVKRAAKSKYEPSQWLEIARPLRDGLRDAQRAALVAYLVPRADAAQGQAWTDAGGLYAHYLIDVEMGSCMMTSRIKQAISSVQLFVQRCFLNLEDDVRADATVDVRWRDWRHMKAYRVWEVARKLFLWPENWVRPELRAGKSPFFGELEAKLMQEEVTAEKAEEAFLGYLEKLDQVAQVEIVGVHHEREVDARGNAAVDVLHVFGRSPGTPPLYWYRRRVDGASWTPWEQIEVDIEADYLLPVIWNRRLYLFWPVLTIGTEEESVTMPAEGEEMPDPRRFWKVRLAWSERREGRWTAKRVTPETDTGRLHAREKMYLSAGFVDADLQVRLRYVFKSTYGGAVTWGGPSFRFAAATPGKVEITPSSGGSALHFPGETAASDMRYVESGAGALSLLAGTLAAPRDVEVLASTPGMRYRLTAPGFPHVDPKEPLFFADGRRTYFVEPYETVAFKRWPEIDVVGPFDIGEIPWHYYVELPLIQDPIGPVIDKGDPAPYVRTFPVNEAIASLGRGDGLTGPVRNLDATEAIALVGRGADAEALAAEALTAEVGRSQPMALRSGTVQFSEESVKASLITLAGAGRSVEAQIVGQWHDVIADAVGISGYWVPRTRYRFSPFYHPYVKEFVRELRRTGVDGMMQRQLQLEPHLYVPGGAPNVTPEPFDFDATYDPRSAVATPYPREDVDWDHLGAYSQYNWELFLHAPLLIADRLTTNQRFEEAQKWLHYVFDPTDTSSHPKPQKWWRMGHFFDTSDGDYQNQQIQRLLTLIATNSPDQALADQVLAWRRDPFNPHAVARIRTTAYQKAVVMQYLDNLIAWGDQLFRRDTIESINEAAQLYVLAGDVLGRRPERISPRAEAVVHTYNTIEPRLDDLSNALVEAESLVPPSNGAIPSGADVPPVTLPALLYFCVPQNDKLLGYWDTVADRLYKIHNCMNIEGVVRQLPLFEPPLDPGMLVKAAAAGMDLSSALADVSAALPPYRFQVMADRARELCAQTMQLGSALLSALEKRDAEALALMRSTHERDLLDAVREVRKLQIDEAAETMRAIERRKDVVTARKKYYDGLLAKGPLPSEVAQFVALGLAGLLQLGQSAMDAVAGGLHLVPNAKVGAPTSLGITYGGENIASSVQSFAGSVGALAAASGTAAQICMAASQIARRLEEWSHHSDQARLELIELDRQIAAADLQVDIATRELETHELQIEQAQAADEFLRTKYTNRELYDWMVGQTSGIYVQSYQLAYDLSKRAERCYRHELGLTDSSFVRFGYWDSLKKGLLSGERLYHDLKRMEASYLDQNRRELELATTISLADLDPHALLRLKETGECFVTLPEWRFDRDHPGHYMRRLKSVSLTIPCVAGPYDGVHATFSLVGGAIRRTTALTGGYARSGPEDPRFTDSTGPVQSIATSHGQADSGMFVVDFRDERYLPFEGQGAADSQWRLVLDPEANRFDFATLGDVLFHVRYTARSGGDPLRAAARAALPVEGTRLVQARSHLADEWQRFLRPPGTAPVQDLVVDLTAARLEPGRRLDLEISRVDLYLAVDAGASPPDLPIEVYADPEAATPELLGGTPLTSLPALGGLMFASVDVSGSPKEPGRWLLRVPGGQIPAPLAETVTVDGTAVKRLRVEAMGDLFVVCHYARV